MGVRAVSVTDEVRTPGPADGGGTPADRYGDQGFDRTPPQDIAAEQCVLGGMMLSKDAIADVVEILRPGDFYRPAHSVVFEAVLNLYSRGEPADVVMVAAALGNAGDLARVGGAPYLHTLISCVPTAANSAYYARIVAERAILRRLVEAGTRIVQMGYGSAAGLGREVDDIVDLAQQAVYDVTERRVSEDFAILADLLQPTLDEIEAVGSRDGVMAGVATGFGDLDRLLNGLHSGQLIVVAGRPGLGKALALDTPLPTPTGWTTMGEVAVGDLLLDASGRPTRVIAVGEVLADRPCYEVVFSDGAVIVADAWHRWVTHTGASRRFPRAPVTRDTEEIRATLHTFRGGTLPNHSITNVVPLALPERDLPVPPYPLGAWLGAGRRRTGVIDTADREIVVRIEADGYTTEEKRSGRYALATELVEGLRAEGVLADKHIPATYLRASESQRRALLAGLMDTQGSVTSAGGIRYRAASARLADDVYELVVGLGYTCGREHPTELSFVAADDVFHIERKRLEHKERRPSGPGAHLRYIVDIRPVESVPVRCVSVDNAERLYLAGRAMVPTHNSTLAMDFARSASVRHNVASAIFSLEMSKIEIVTRLLAAEARVPLHVLRSGQLSDDDWTRLARRMGEISEAPIFVDDTPNMNLMEIRAKARRLRQRHDLKLIVVDYLQLMTSPKRVESRQQEVADLSRGLKLLAKELEVPVIAVSQLNRGPEQRTDKRPQLSDLRESGSIEQDADVVVLLHRDDYYDRESPRAGEADLIIAKHRNGPTDTITVAAQLHFSRFVDMAII